MEKSFFEIAKSKWTREPKSFLITADKIEIITKPHTDLWQRTYYHFRNDNAPVFQIETEEKYFSFTFYRVLPHRSERTLPEVHRAPVDGSWIWHYHSWLCR